jgi:hypothetical protein
MDAYYAQIRKLEGKFYGIDYHHIPHDANQAADRLSKLGSSRAKVPARVFVQDLINLSIQEEQSITKTPPTEQLVMAIPTPTSDWREPFIKYLTSGEVPSDKSKMERFIRHSKRYVLVDGKLMWKNAREELLQKCNTQEEGEKLLLKIHAGSCGNYAASRNLVGKAF